MAIEVYGTMSQKFVIIDGSSLVHRAFYALPELQTASGLHTNAVYGFANMLVKLIDDLKPEMMAVAFDKGRVTFRNNIYNEYKAQRKPTPQELSEQFPLVRDLVNAFGIVCLEEAGFEADDIIGTLATKGAQSGVEVIVVTGDRDALQLISPQVQVLLTKKGISDMEKFDDAAFEAKYGVRVSQFVDLKGLMGDSSDNIPGVPGVGEKTAVKLIQEFGSIENILGNIEAVQGAKLKERLTLHAELARTSKELSRIMCEMDLKFVPEDFMIKPEAKRLQELCVKLEFRNLLTRIAKIIPAAVCATAPADVPQTPLPQVDIINTEDQVTALLVDVRQEGRAAVYPVISGRVPDIELVGLSIVTESKSSYISVDAAGWNDIVAMLSDVGIAKIVYDAKTMHHISFILGCSIKGIGFDVMLAAYLLDPIAANYPLSLLGEKYLGYEVEQFAVSEACENDFAAWAAQVVYQLYPVLQEKLQQNELEDLYDSIELPLAEALAWLEATGICINREYLIDMTAEITEKVEKLLIAIQEMAGEPFNVNSTKQLGVVLFDKLRLPVFKKTKTGYSTDAEVLEKLSGEHPIIDKLLEYRLLTKLKSTYLEGMQGLIHPITGRIHTSFNQTITATGRLSSSDPNLQNIPIRTEIGRRIRELFVPGEGYQYIMAADYSQIELRILAHLSHDKNLIDAFVNLQDVHSRTAAEVFDTPIEDVTSEMRSRAKAVNFGIVYGISDYGLARDIGVSRKEAAQYIENYFARYEGVKKFMTDIVREAHEFGFVTTLFGRRRYLPDINSKNFNLRSFAERTAMNTPIQGTAADIIKRAMIDVCRALREQGLKSRVLLQVHDELVLEVVGHEAQQVAALVKQAMEQAAHLVVPLTVDVKFGNNWAEAK